MPRGNLGEPRGKQGNGTHDIYAVDFDGTLCVNKYPIIGEPNIELIKWLKKKQKKGAKLILWTCRENLQLDYAVAWCLQYGLEFDAINENLPEMIEKWGVNCRKVGADYFIDDKSMSIEGIEVPFYG